MAHWRDTARNVRFFTIDARASFPLLLFLIHMRMWTLMLALLVAVTFFLLEQRGLTIPLAMRRLRLFFIGSKRPANATFKKHKFRDRGGY